jgi:hypothetical protein
MNPKARKLARMGVRNDSKSTHKTRGQQENLRKENQDKRKKERKHETRGPTACRRVDTILDRPCV